MWSPPEALFQTGISRNIAREPRTDGVFFYTMDEKGEEKGREGWIRAWMQSLLTPC